MTPELAELTLRITKRGADREKTGRAGRSGESSGVCARREQLRGLERQGLPAGECCVLSGKGMEWFRKGEQYSDPSLGQEAGVGSVVGVTVGARADPEQ